jgi:hypothetical protein
MVGATTRAGAGLAGTLGAPLAALAFADATRDNGDYSVAVTSGAVDLKICIISFGSGNGEMQVAFGATSDCASGFAHNVSLAHSTSYCTLDDDNLATSPLRGLLLPPLEWTNEEIPRPLSDRGMTSEVVMPRVLRNSAQHRIALVSLVVRVFPAGNPHVEVHARLMRHHWLGLPELLTAHLAAYGKQA